MPVFVDTNLFVYRLDALEPEKQTVARDVLESLAERHIGVISTQVMTELSSVLLGKRADLANPSTARRIVEELALDWLIVSVRPHTIDLAFDGVERFGFSWYDAQIWAAARSAECAHLLSEDSHDGLDADGVQIVNPFAEGFDVAAFLSEVASG